MKGIKISNETKVGVLAAISITVLVLGFNFMKGKSLFARNHTYYAVYTRVEGLAPSNPVLVNGYRVGQVSSVKMILNNDSMVFKVSFNVREDLPININSIAKIINADLFGSKAIEIVMGKAGTPLAEGNELKSEVEPALLSTVASVAAPLKEKVEAILVSLDSIFSGQSGRDLRNTFSHIETITKNFESTSANLDHMIAEETKKLDEIFTNVVSISNNLKNNNQKITSAINNLERFSDTLASIQLKKIVQDAENTLAQVASITDKINKGEGSLGLLVNDKQLYNSLDASAKSLDALLKDMEANPKRYVHFSIFGRKDKKPK